MTQQAKENAALAALELVAGGMVLGLGSGSTSAAFISALAENVRHGLSVTAAAASSASEDLARQGGIDLISPDETTHFDLYVDGADEIDQYGNLIKGGGAAHLREKILARAARRFIVIADHSKDVTQLGAFPLPIEIDPFCAPLTVRAVRETLQELGFAGAPLDLRSAKDGGGFLRTDGGNLILDAKLGRIVDPAAVDNALNMIPGVIENGLFVGMADEIILGREEGTTQRKIERRPS